MAKTTRKTGQTFGTAPTQPHPQGVAEDEPQVELEDEKMDAETLTTNLIVLQEELANSWANQENRDATAALEAAIQLARGQHAPTSQPDQPPNTHPQQNPQLDHPQHHHNPPQPANPLRLEQPPTAQQERSFQDPEQQPPSRAGQENPQQHRQYRAGQRPRSPRRRTAEEQNPPSRGQRPSASRRQVESGSAVRGPPRHNNVRGPTDQRRPPPTYRDIPAGRGK
ncbi:transcriptional activator ptaB-like [Humulus lupulus]|uniref:transcriptional activator ptaB-like n=1 Tax=Humulus lupulus TaxID=3486 RepID=UPI002B406D6E|nr:transcriptional activator ptaB-like [Humulus lupulus]